MVQETAPSVVPFYDKASTENLRRSNSDAQTLPGNTTAPHRGDRAVGQDVAQARPRLDVNFQLLACFLQLRQREQNMFRVDC